MQTSVGYDDEVEADVPEPGDIVETVEPEGDLDAVVQPPLGREQAGTGLDQGGFCSVGESQRLHLAALLLQAQALMLLVRVVGGES